MWHLVLVSLIWAFSFGLIKRHLVGVDSAFVTAVRLGLAVLVFLPFLRLRGLALRTALGLVAIGALQFGLMYLAYIESFRFLRAYEAALFTLTTPIFVTLLADALERTLRLQAFLAALLSVAGAALVVVRSNHLELTWVGLALVQLSNLAFAAGQVFYRRWRPPNTAVSDRDVFGLLYLGGFAVALVAMAVRVDLTALALSSTQVITLAYLGVVASGLGFFLWNVGATRVGAGSLAVMNNLKVPLGVAVSLLFFGEEASLPSLAASIALMATATWLAGSPGSRPSS